jgi:hypothetical protein
MMRSRRELTSEFPDEAPACGSLKPFQRQQFFCGLALRKMILERVKKAKRETRPDRRTGSIGYSRRPRLRHRQGLPGAVGRIPLTDAELVKAFRAGSHSIGTPARARPSQ